MPRQTATLTQGASLESCQPDDQCMLGKPEEELAAKFGDMTFEAEAVLAIIEELVQKHCKDVEQVKAAAKKLAELQTHIRSIQIPGRPDSQIPGDADSKKPHPELSAPVAKRTLFRWVKFRTILKLGVAEEACIEQNAQPPEIWAATFAKFEVAMTLIKRLRKFLPKQRHTSTDLSVQHDVHHCEGRPDEVEKAELQAAIRASEVEALQGRPDALRDSEVEDTDDLWHPYAAMKESTTWEVSAPTALETNGTLAAQQIATQTMSQQQFPFQPMQAADQEDTRWADIEDSEDEHISDAVSEEAPEVVQTATPWGKSAATKGAATKSWGKTATATAPWSAGKGKGKPTYTAPSYTPPSFSKGSSKGGFKGSFKGGVKGKGKKGAPGANSPFWKEKEAGENRQVLEGTYTGTIQSYNIKFGWGFLLPDSVEVLPAEAQEKIAQANVTAAEKGKEGQNLLYFRKPDIVAGVKVAKDQPCTFSVYIDDKGAGACEVSC
jgi:hypothetical protein